jgi:putative peptide zinc metalloprotease protein
MGLNFKKKKNSRQELTTLDFERLVLSVLPTPVEPEINLWDNLEIRLIELDSNLDEQQAPPGYDLWDTLETRIDPNQWKPRRLDEYEVQPDKEGEKVVYYLKSKPAKAFLKLGEPQLFVWERMDGEHTVREIMYAYRDRFGSMPIFGIMQSINTFKNCGMLQERRESLWDRLVRFMNGDTALQPTEKRTILQRLNKSKLSLPQLDKYTTAIYRRGGWLLFQPLIWLPVLLISLAGAGLLLFTLFSQHPLSRQITDFGPAFYILVTVLTLFPMIFVHEMMHALAVKHFGREVMGGGIMLMRGMPAFYIDTTDMWMDRNKWHRVTVSVVGPFSNLFLASVFTILAWQVPFGWWSALIFALALNNFFSFLLNLCPLVELDGYYALMDACGESGLRGKSLRFLRQELPRRWYRCYRFKRQEWLYTIFGSLALMYMVVMLLNIGVFMFGLLFSNPLTTAALVGLGLPYLVYRLVKQWLTMRRWRKQIQSGEFDLSKLPPQARAAIGKYGLPPGAKVGQSGKAAQVRQSKN